MRTKNGASESPLRRSRHAVSIHGLPSLRLSRVVARPFKSTAEGYAFLSCDPYRSSTPPLQTSEDTDPS